MMRSFAAAILSFSCAVGTAQAEALKSFRLKAGDQTFQLDAGETVELVAPDGSKIPLTLERNEFATYSGDSFSFNHPTSLSVARSDVGDSIVQHLMASALGTLVIVQEYRTMNPSSLTELMMQEVTKETIGAGGTRQDEQVERTLDGGEVMKGLKSSVTFNGDTAFYEVLTYGTTNAGIVAVTRVDQRHVAAEGGALSTFWDTLDLK